MAHAHTVTSTVTSPTPDIVQSVVDSLRHSQPDLAVTTPAIVPSTSRENLITPVSEEIIKALQYSQRILTRFRARLTGVQPVEHPINRRHAVRIGEPSVAPFQAADTLDLQLEEDLAEGIVRQLFT